jgi:hypothetical protein
VGAISHGWLRCVKTILEKKYMAIDASPDMDVIAAGMVGRIEHVGLVKVDTDLNTALHIAALHVPLAFNCHRTDSLFTTTSAIWPPSKTS